MKKVVCVVDNHLYLEYGKTFQRIKKVCLSQNYIGGTNLFSYLWKSLDKNK